MRQRKVFAPRNQKREEEYNYDKDFRPIDLLTEVDQEERLENDKLPELTYPAFRTKAFQKVAEGKTNIGLYLNNEGNHVQVINNALITLGHLQNQSELTRYSTATEQAMKAFQLSYKKLLPWGYLNAETLTVLNEALQDKKALETHNTAFVHLDKHTSELDIKENAQEKKAKPSEVERLSFVIPVPSAMNPRPTHIHIFKHIFNVGTDKAIQILDALLKDKGSYTNLWKQDFIQFTDAHKNKGYITFSLSILLYNTYAAQNIPSKEAYTQERFPDWDEQMQWFNNLKSGSLEDKQLRQAIFKTTDQRFKALTGLDKVNPNNENLVKLYNELLYETIKTQRGDNPYNIKDYRTRERIQNRIDSFTPEQKRVFEDRMNHRESEDYYYYDGNYDEAMEHFVTAFDAYYQMINGDHFTGFKAGQQDNYETNLNDSLKRLKDLKANHKLPFHSGISKGERYQRLVDMLDEKDRSSEILVTLTRGLNPQEQEQFWNDTHVQRKLARDLYGTQLVQAIATHKVNYEQKTSLLNSKAVFSITYATYRELVFYSNNGATLLQTLDAKYNKNVIVNYYEGGQLRNTQIHNTNGAYDPLLEDRAVALPNLSVFKEAAALNSDLIVAWKAESDESFLTSAFRHTPKEDAYDKALADHNFKQNAFEKRAETLEDEFIPWFQNQAVKQAHNILDASEQFLYAEFNKLADRGVQDLMTDMQALTPQFELLNILFSNYVFGNHFYKDRNGNLASGTSPIGRAMYSEKYHTLRSTLINFLRSRHPLLYDAFDGDLYDIRDLFAAYRADPKAFEANMLKRFETELGNKQQGIFETRNNLRIDGEDVWKLKGVIVYTMQLLGLHGAGDGFEAMVLSRLQESKGVSGWLYLGLIALSLVGGPIAVAAAVGLAAASAIDVAIQYNDYSIKSSAADAVVQDADGLIQLADDPSVLWLAIAIAGLALDIGPAFKAFAKLSKVAKIETAADLAKFNAQLDEVAKLEKLSDKIKLNLKKQAELELAYKKSYNELRVKVFEVNAGINPNALPIFIEVAELFIKRGVNTFERFLLELKLHNFIKSVDNLTDEELTVLKEAFEKGKTKSNLNTATKKVIDQADNLDIKLGKKIGEGGNKEVYEILNSADEVIAVLKKGKPQNAIDKEVALLKELSDEGLLVVKIIKVIKYGDQPALIMKKYVQGSKEIVKRVKGKARVVGESKYLNNKSVKDLTKIKTILENKKISIDDIQFLISKDGSIVIADPLNVYFGSKPSQINLNTINLLIKEARKKI